jgi:hypothetical protein
MTFEHILISLSLLLAAPLYAWAFADVVYRWLGTMYKLPEPASPMPEAVRTPDCSKCGQQIHACWYYGGPGEQSGLCQTCEME